MSLPAIALALVVASLYAGLFHLAYAQKASDLARYWPAAIVGFLVGAALGLFIPWRFLVLGELHLLEGTAGTAAALYLVRWLGSGAERKRPS